LKGINAKTEFQVNQIKSFEMISFRRTLCLFVQTYYAKHITSFSSVSIVKRGIYCYPFFEAPHKRKYQKIREKRKYKKIKKILEEKKQKKNILVEKNISERLGNCQRLVEEDQNIQDWKI